MAIYLLGILCLIIGGFGLLALSNSSPTSVEQPAQENNEEGVPL